jgi:hypothetical protein
MSSSTEITTDYLTVRKKATDCDVHLRLLTFLSDTGFRLKRRSGDIKKQREFKKGTGQVVSVYNHTHSQLHLHSAPKEPSTHRPNN